MNAAPVQLDMFALNAASASPLIGTEITPDWLEPCSCGARTVVIGSSGGPHVHRLICIGCTRFRAWLGVHAAAVLTASLAAHSSKVA
jgi:hypothetical protein